MLRSKKNNAGAFSKKNKAYTKLKAINRVFIGVLLIAAVVKASLMNHKVTMGVINIKP